MLLWQLFLEQSRTFELSHLANHSEEHITQALNVVFIVGIFSVTLPTHNLTITFLIFFNLQPREILLLAHDSASPSLMADRVGKSSQQDERKSFIFRSSLLYTIIKFCSFFPFRHKYEFLHNGWSPDLRITVNPVRIGVALDYERGTLSFFNVDLEQHLHTFHCHFQNYVHPCFGLDNPGALTVHNGIEAPEYTFIWHQQLYLESLVGSDITFIKTKKKKP